MEKEVRSQKTEDGSHRLKHKKQNPEIAFGVFYLIELNDLNYFALSRVIVFVG